MPCTPAKARILMKDGHARPKRNKLGIFYIQLTYAVEPDSQPLVVGIDPGSKFEGFSVVGTKDTVLNIMAEAPTHVKKSVEVRRVMRRARRQRKCWRRPARFDNRLTGTKRLPQSTRSRWEFKARIIRHLAAILPITEAVVEDVRARTRTGKGGKWHGLFSPIQVGKEHLYSLIENMGLHVRLFEGHHTASLRAQARLSKIKAKDKPVFESHAVDAWVLAAAATGADRPTCRRLWYVTGIQLKRRMLHKLQPARGGYRRPEGGTMSLGLKRGTVVWHSRYGLCSVGGFDRQRQRISLHRYHDNKRLTQDGRITDLKVCTWSSFRSRLIFTRNDGGVGV